MSPRFAAWLAWPLVALTLLLFAAANLLQAAAPPELVSNSPRWLPAGLASLAFLPYAAVGALIASRRPGNPIGWVFLAIGLGAEIGPLARGYVSYALFVAPGALPAVQPAAWMLNSWVVSFGLLPLLFLVFPTGRLPSSRWRAVGWLVPVFVVLDFLTAESSVGLPVQARPPLLAALFGQEVGLRIAAVGSTVTGLLMLGLFVAAAAAMVVRFVRTRGEERQQVKWIAYASLLLALLTAVTAALFFSPLREALDPTARVPASMFGGVPLALALTAIPVAAGIAILRYRLYDIDLLINRTLVYGALTAGLGLVYWGGVVLLQQLLRPFTQGSELAIIGSTLAVAALFQPARKRIQQFGRPALLSAEV